MKIVLNNLFCSVYDVKLNASPGVHSLMQRVMKIGLMMLGIGLLFYYFFSSHKFKAKKIGMDKLSVFQEKKSPVREEIPQEKISPKRMILGEKEKNEWINLSGGKVRALDVYQEKNEKCGRVHKSIIFQDIKFIKSPSKIKKEMNSIEDLIFYFSKSDSVNLEDPLSAQVVIDAFRECNQETSDQLCQWLSDEKTFNIPLFKRCLEVFVEKDKQQRTFSVYTLEFLMKIYKERNWHEIKNVNSEVEMSTDHPLIVFIMSILIKELPNEDRIIALTEWMIEQKDYSLETFSKWIRIFQVKEQEKKAINLYYPLLDKMIAHFHKKWGLKYVNQIDKEIQNFFQSKISLKNMDPV